MPSHSRNSKDAYENGKQVTDAIASWITAGYVFGPIHPESAPTSKKVNGIMTRTKPDGSVRVILNLSAPAGQSVNDGIDNADFPATMSSTKAWLDVLNNAGHNCWISKTDWADAYKHFTVRQEDLDLQWFEWGGMLFREQCLVFGGISSAGIFDDGAKLFVDLGTRIAQFPNSMVCQHLDDICAAASCHSDKLHQLERAFTELANFIGVKLAPKDNPEKAFPPAKQGIVFGIAYDTSSWTWHLPTEKLHRILLQIRAALSASEWPEKEVKSLVGKLIHIKALIPDARFNSDHIMHWLALSNDHSPVIITDQCKKQLAFWHDLLLTTDKKLSIPDSLYTSPPWALSVYCDAAGGSNLNNGVGSGGVCGPLWYYLPWSAKINLGLAKWQEKKVGRKLTALELIGPLVFISAIPDAFRRQPVIFWIDNIGSVLVWNKGYSTHCTLSTTIVKAIAAAAAALQCTVEFKKITRRSNTGAKLADNLSKAAFSQFFAEADQHNWPLCQDPLKIPPTICKWIADPDPQSDLADIVITHLNLVTKTMYNS